MFDTLPNRSQDPLDQELHAAIRESLDRLWLDGQWASYQTDLADQFAQQLRDHYRMPTVRLCCSGSMAMELALRVCQLEAADEVICCAIDYPGNMRMLRMLGVQPVVVDCIAGRWTIDPEAVDQAATPRTRAVIASHLYGEVAEMHRLRDLCDQRRWLLIEDACQMPYGFASQLPVGSFGDFTTLSFGGSKPFTAGRGGALLVRQSLHAQRLSAYADRPSDVSGMSSLQVASLLPQWRLAAALLDRQRCRLLDLISQCQQASLPWHMGVPLPGADFGSCFKIPISKRGGWDSTQRQTFEDSLVNAGLAVGKPFRTLTKVLPGRGRLVSFEHAVWMESQNVMLDHRCLAGSSHLTAQILEILKVMCTAA